MKLKVITIILAGILCLPLTSCLKKSTAVLNISSEKLKSTLITAHMEENITNDKNLIFCNTFQLAWNELKQTVVKGDVFIENDPSMVKYLNKSLSSKNDLSKEFYVALAGMKKDDIIKKINNELKDKFDGEAPTVVENMQRDDDIFAYAFLLKDLQFNKVFENLKDTLFFNGTKVQCFGIKDYEAKNREMAEQVDVKDYISNSDFIIGLKAKNSTDEIILGEVEPKSNLMETYKNIEARIKSGSSAKLAYGDKLMIPKFDFNIKHSYEELLGKNIKNKGFEDYFIIKAMQETRFKLDEKGVKLRSEARIGASKSAPVQGKQLIFNKPFIFYMKEKGAEYPYFMMWVDNSEIMLK